MVLIDTHILVWWVNESESLSTTARNTIEDALKQSEVLVSSITAWEMAMLVEKNRLVLTMDIENWLDQVAQIDGIRFVPVDNEIGVKSTKLPGEFHKDPADRIIVATARKYAIPLVTADENILDYAYVKTIW